MKEPSRRYVLQLRLTHKVTVCASIKSMMRLIIDMSPMDTSDMMTGFVGARMCRTDVIRGREADQHRDCSNGTHMTLTTK